MSDIEEPANVSEVKQAVRFEFWRTFGGTIAGAIVGGCLSFFGSTYVQRQQFAFEKNSEVRRSRELVYSRISGFGEELMQTFHAYASAVALQKLGKTQRTRLDEDALQIRIDDLAIKKAKLRQDLLETIGLVRIYFKVTPLMIKDFDKIRDCRSVHFDSIFSEDKIPEINKEITSIVASCYTEPLYEIENEIRSQL